MQSSIPPYFSNSMPFPRIEDEYTNPFVIHQRSEEIVTMAKEILEKNGLSITVKLSLRLNIFDITPQTFRNEQGIQVLNLSPLYLISPLEFPENLRVKSIVEFNDDYFLALQKWILHELCINIKVKQKVNWREKNAFLLYYRIMLQEPTEVKKAFRWTLRHELAHALHHDHSVSIMPNKCIPKLILVAGLITACGFVTARFCDSKQAALITSAVALVLFCCCFCLPMARAVRTHRKQERAADLTAIQQSPLNISGAQLLFNQIQEQNRIVRNSSRGAKIFITPKGDSRLEILHHGVESSRVAHLQAALPPLSLTTDKPEEV